MPDATRLGAPVVERAHGPAGDAREVRREQTLDRGALLAAEAAAHELAGHVHAVGIEPERLGELPARVEDALRRDPDAQLVLRPVGDGAVRLEGLLHLGGRAVLGLDDHVGLGEARLDVAALALARILGEALLGEALLEVDHEPERLVARARARQRPRAPPPDWSLRARRPRRRRTRAPTRARPRPRAAAHLPGPATASTPGTARAAARSSSTRACACGERTTTASSMPGSAMSEMKRALPETRLGPVRRGAATPTTASSDESGQRSM